MWCCFTDFFFLKIYSQCVIKFPLFISLIFSPSLSLSLSFNIFVVNSRLVGLIDHVAYEFQRFCFAKGQWFTAAAYILPVERSRVACIKWSARGCRICRGLAWRCAGDVAASHFVNWPPMRSLGGATSVGSTAVGVRPPGARLAPELHRGCRQEDATRRNRGARDTACTFRRSILSVRAVLPSFPLLNDPV